MFSKSKKEMEMEFTPQEYKALAPYTAQVDVQLAKIFFAAKAGSTEDLAAACADLSVLFFCLGKNSVKES